MTRDEGEQADEIALSRRDFFRLAGATGAAALLAKAGALAQTTEPATQATQPTQPSRPTVPTRPFGATGVRVPILSLGGMFNTMSGAIILRQAVRFGVTYWDTSAVYGGGRSERGIGQYLRRFADDREKVLLATKSPAGSVSGMQRHLEQSLERLGVESVDFFLMHGASDPDAFTSEVKSWVERMKKAGRFRLFGFSTHKNMPACLTAAAKLGWIDGAMTSYNVRLMQEAEMQRAVEACHKAGLGLTAMKTTARGPKLVESDAERQLVERFVDRGFTLYQALLKAVWADERFASICSQMPNITILMANAAAAMDKTSLTAGERALLERYAAETRHGWCSGCGACERATGRPVPDVMRCLMYRNDYGDVDLARRTFADLPRAARRGLTAADYSAAERACPNTLPIAELLREAEETLT